MIKIVISAVVLILVAPMVEARTFVLSKGAGYSIEPLYGFETIYRSSPRSYIKSRAIYGLRLTAGKPLLSGELEYARASDTENYSTAPEKIYYQDDKYKVGITSTAYLGKHFFMAGRAGAQATEGIQEETSGGVKTTKEKGLQINPYAGVKLGIQFGVVRINAGSTMVFNDYKDFSKNELQHSVSLGIGY